MNWEDSNEFEEVFSEIRKELYKDDFFHLMMIENVEKFLEFLKEHLVSAQDDDLLSDILKLAMDDYNKYEVDLALDELSEKGLIRMVLREDGKLAYEATEEGLAVNDIMAQANIEYLTQNIEQTNKIMDINYSSELYKVTGVDDSIRFVDHGDNFDFVVIPAGKQHDGEKFVKFYHTIFTHYNDPSPNGQYELVDEFRLFELLNTNYNQSK
jgi:hypothetical protein